jgi:hypothetical protein
LIITQYYQLSMILTDIDDLLKFLLHVLQVFHFLYCLLILLPFTFLLGLFSVSCLLLDRPVCLRFLCFRSFFVFFISD